MPKTNIVTFRVDGTDHPVDLYDIDGLEWKRARLATGLKPYELCQAALDEQPDFEAVAALLWIVQSRDNPRLKYDTVLKSFSYGAVVRDEDEGEPSTPLD